MRKNLFVCDSTQPLIPEVEEAVKNYKTLVRNSCFEICDTNSIPSKSFSYFDDFYRIYVFDDETAKRIRKSFNIDSYKFCIIKLNKNMPRERKLRDILCDFMLQNQ